LSLIDWRLVADDTPPAIPMTMMKRMNKTKRTRTGKTSPRSSENRMTGSNAARSFGVRDEA
jgi:hypothetical protein